MSKSVDYMSKFHFKPDTL